MVNRQNAKLGLETGIILIVPVTLTLSPIREPASCLVGRRCLCKLGELSFPFIKAILLFPRYLAEISSYQGDAALFNMSFIGPEIDLDLWLQPGWDVQEASLPQSDLDHMRPRRYYQEASATSKPSGFVLPDEIETEATSTGLSNRYNDCDAVLEASLAAAKDNVSQPNTLGGADETSINPDFIMQSIDLESFKDVLSGEFSQFSDPGDFGDFDSLLAPSIGEYPASGAQTQATRTANNLSQVFNPISSPFALPWNACPQLPGGKSCGALFEQSEASSNFIRDDSKISNPLAFPPHQYPQPFLVDDGGAASTISCPIEKQGPMLQSKQVIEVLGPFEADKQSSTGIFGYSNLTQASIAQTTVNDLPSNEVSDHTGAPRIELGSVNGSRKRSLVVQMPPSNKRIKTPKGVPHGLCTAFSARLSNVAQIATRERSKRVCLRCRDQKLKVRSAHHSTLHNQISNWQPLTIKVFRPNSLHKLPSVAQQSCCSKVSVCRFWHSVH